MPVNVHLRVSPLVPSGQILVGIEAVLSRRNVSGLFRNSITRVYPV